ncbi:hypothetical protein ACP275_12G087700 [Erythranthe tilingii]
MASRMMIFFVALLLISLGSTASIKYKCRVDDDCDRQYIICPYIINPTRTFCREGFCYCSPFPRRCFSDADCAPINLICGDAKKVCRQGLCICNK